LKGVFSTLYLFNGSIGSGPVALVQHTDGLLYGDTTTGTGTGQSNGIFYSWSIGAKPFIRLESTSGKVGSQVGILGQGFDSSSVVKFGGVAATSIMLTGTTYIVATVPAGAVDGKVTVTTGSTTLTSTKTYIVHDSWNSGAAMPTALDGPAVGVIKGKVYVVGGGTNSGTVAINQIYNPSTNKWTTGASMPTARFSTAYAVVNNILYVIGGTADGSTPLSVVQAYNPKTNTWSTKAPMPTATASASAVVKSGIVYVIGGYANGGRTVNVESYNPATNTWTDLAPLPLGKSLPAVGLLGSTIVAAGGLDNSGLTGDNEGYNSTLNTWSNLAADPTPRQASCSAAISGLLYSAGGSGAGTFGTPLSVVESFSATAKKWTTLSSMPQAVLGPGSGIVNIVTNGVANNMLYCFGGSNDGRLGQGTVYNNVQIYQP
jgi:N-acetylneuraminic acid mutarotase